MECRKQGINIGYCPQVDALDGMLTGEEHLYFYGRIRGISKRQLDGVRNKSSTGIVSNLRHSTAAAALGGLTSHLTRSQRFNSLRRRSCCQPSPPPPPLTLSC